MQDQIYADEAMPADATASGENYQEITENAFCDTVQQPVSTFSPMWIRHPTAISAE